MLISIEILFFGSVILLSLTIFLFYRSITNSHSKYHKLDQEYGVPNENINALSDEDQFKCWCLCQKYKDVDNIRIISLVVVKDNSDDSNITNMSPEQPSSSESVLSIFSSDFIEIGEGSCCSSVEQQITPKASAEKKNENSTAELLNIINCAFPDLDMEVNDKIVIMGRELDYYIGYKQNDNTKKVGKIKLKSVQVDREWFKKTLEL